MTADAEAAIWAAINALVHPSLRRIDHDIRGEIYGEVPSLWDQANASLYGEVGPGGPSGPKEERSVADLDLMERLSIIADTTAHELAERKIAGPFLMVRGKKVPDTPPQLVLLAQHVVKHEQDHLWWWVYRFASWANWLEVSLKIVDRPRLLRYIRSTPCPRCRTRQVTVEGDDGSPVVVSALMIVWRDDLVRNIECQRCHYQWPRGEGMRLLGDLVRRRTA
jgi:hypothetical protein